MSILTPPSFSPRSNHNNPFVGVISDGMVLYVSNGVHMHLAGLRANLSFPEWNVPMLAARFKLYANPYLGLGKVTLNANLRADGLDTNDSVAMSSAAFIVSRGIADSHHATYGRSILSSDIRETLFSYLSDLRDIIAGNAYQSALGVPDGYP